jgi:hypothetical protein
VLVRLPNFILGLTVVWSTKYVALVKCFLFYADDITFTVFTINFVILIMLFTQFYPGG